MENNFSVEKQFLAIIPDKEEAHKISDNTEVERYIHKTIISKPCYFL